MLFLCVHNAGRSQMAAGWMRHLAGDAVEVYSGGRSPRRRSTLRRSPRWPRSGSTSPRRFPSAGRTSARAADVIVTMGCGDAVPSTRKHYEDWELDDPAAQPVEVVRAIRDDIAARVRDLLASLGINVRK